MEVEPILLKEEDLSPERERLLPQATQQAQSQEATPPPSLTVAGGRPRLTE